ncbi:hypothetical protein [Bradyrhizobium sp. LA7.1]|uniref:hypothetical protein n=1 Tax=Bradyrhizobium sp. LA7.1 TaxID=3156324 RepID=UPI003399E3AE
MPVFSNCFNFALEREIGADPVVRANTRYGRLPLVLGADDASAFRIILDRGRLLGLTDWTADDERNAVFVSGSVQQWQHAFGLHGGLHRAWRYRLLAFTGDQVRMMTFWKTIWRVGEALQKIAKERP